MPVGDFQGLQQSLSFESWRVLRILGEFVEGFDTLAHIGSTVSVFGSSRTRPGEPYYDSAIQCGERLARLGIPVMTGGGPGIMEAANRGAFEAGGVSIGLNITLPLEQKPNDYQTHELNFQYFFCRKVMFVKYAKGFIIFPGGYGTMDEFFESLTLIQTLKIAPFPIVCVGREFWAGLIGWMRDTLDEQCATIDHTDLDLFTVTDDVEEAVEIVRSHISRERLAAPRAVPHNGIGGNGNGNGNGAAVGELANGQASWARAALKRPTFKVQRDGQAGV